MSPKPEPVDRDGVAMPHDGLGVPVGSSLHFESDAETFLTVVGAQLTGALVIRTGDPALAEELASEAIARAWADWAHVSTMENPTGWVFRVGFNLTASHWRRRAARRRIDDRQPVRDDAVHLRTAEALVMRDAIAQLSEQQQRIVILRFYVQMSVRETADTLQVSTGTVKTQTSRAMARLRTMLDEGA
jgi:RNA polymerase sigma factor (sigma-70 family)